MGILVEGVPIAWEDMTDDITRLVRRLAVEQFLKHWSEWEKRAESDPPRDLKWGEEIEYTLVRMDDTAKSAALSCRAPEVLGALHYPAESVYSTYITWHPEYARWMVEGTPGQPYGNLSSDLLLVEQNMSLRRRAVLPALNFDEVMVSIPVFPLIGMPSALSPPAALPSSVRGPVMESDYFPDSVINPHPRFPTLTANIRKRRGAKVSVTSPVFLDANTRAALLAADGGAGAAAVPTTCDDCGARPAAPAAVVKCVECAAVFCPECDARVHGGKRLAKHVRTPVVTAAGPGPKVPHVREVAGGGVEAEFDAMAFGMGTSCLQCTFQARDLKEARVLYDAFVPLAPLLLALSAGSPAYGGLLLDTDCRWNSIAASVDDRTPHERGDCPHAAPPPPGTAAAAATAADACCARAHNGARRLAKSRYSSVSLYLGGGPGFRAAYNDVAVEVDEAALAALGKAGVDADLARHVAYLLVRDPLVVFRDRLGAAGEDLAKGGAGTVPDEVVVASAAATGAEHYDNFNTSNWNSVRLKLPVPPPPPPGAAADAAAGGGIGWRVEFRPLEVQMSDFENAALVVFVTLLSRMVLTFGLTTYMPVSLVDANFARAHVRNAATSARFYFPRKLLARDAACGGAVFDGLGGRSRAVSNPPPTSPSGGLACPAGAAHCVGSGDAACAFGLTPPCPPTPGATPGCLPGGGGGALGGGSSAACPQAGTGATGEEPAGAARWAEEVGEFTLAEIFCGGGAWVGPGLVTLCHNYLDIVDVVGDARAVLNQYLDLIEGRARGTLATPAAWMRGFITKHPSYRGDSVVPQAAAYELIKQVCDIADGRVCVPELFGFDESALWPRGPSMPGYSGRRARIPDLPAGMSPPLAPVRHIGRPLTALRRPPPCPPGRLPSTSAISTSPLAAGRPAAARSELLALLFPRVGSAVPPLDFSLSEVASQCLREARSFHPQLRTDEGSDNTICNHAYMTLMSLAHLGAGDVAVNEWLSLSLFESVREDATLPPITAANWRAHLSCGVNGFRAYKTWFSSEIARVGRSCVLAGTVPFLLAGVMRGMFHPVIRLAHSLFDEPDASADALAYWCIRYQSMFPGAEECVAAHHAEAGPGGQDASLSPADVLTRIQVHFGPLAAGLPAGTVLRHEHSENILARSNFRRFALLLAGTAESLFTTALRLCLRVYRSSPSFHSLHMVTGLTALLLVSRAVPASREAAARVAWLLACVNLFLHGFPPVVDEATAPLPAAPAEGVAERWAALRAAVLGSEHVHIIKLVWACTIIQHDVPDPLALEVCEMAVRMGRPW